MKKLSLKEVKRRIRNHEALPDDVVKWYPKLMSRYSIRKAKRNPDGFTGKESRPRLKRYGKGEYRRSARSKELYPRAFVKNPKGRWLRFRDGGKEYETLYNEHTNSYPIKIRDSETLEPVMFSDVRPSIYEAAVRALQRHYAELHSDNPSRISRIKSHVKAHLDKDQRDFQKEIDEDDELKRWLDTNPKFSAAQRRKYAASGVALPDGSFPIRNRKDLMDALHDLGRTKHYAAAKKHIIKRARALGLTADLNPEWVRRKGKKRNPIGEPGYYETVLYGKRKGSEYEELLSTQPERFNEVKRIAAKDGFGHFRIVKIDLSAPPDFVATIKGRPYPKRNPKQYREMRNGDLVLAR